MMAVRNPLDVPGLGGTAVTDRTEPLHQTDPTDRPGATDDRRRAAHLALVDGPYEPIGIELRDRPTLVDRLAAGLAAAGVRHAFQGPADAVDQWTGQDGPADLDVWVAERHRVWAAGVMRGLGATLIASARVPGRLQHDVWGLLVGGRPAVVDLTIGDLRVGPVLICAESAMVVDTDPAGRGRALPHFTGVAATADLAVRPLLRGKEPPPARLAEARDAWASTPAPTRLQWAVGINEVLGRRLTTDVLDMLAGERPAAGLAGRCRRALTRATVQPDALPGVWDQRAAIVPTRRPGPFGLRHRGVLVALVGTDGSGKSTVADDLDADLRAAGFSVSRRYFGMARGNLPGIGLVRRALGVAPDPEPADPEPADLEPGPAARDDATGPDVRTTEPANPAPAPDSVLAGGPSTGGPTAEAAPLAHPQLRKIAAWYYAAEYLVRYAVHVAPARARGRIVVCDRWVTDLRFGPWPGSRASALVERLVGWPDVLVLPDAPAHVIHDRKPERTVAEIGAQQASLHALLAAAPEQTTTLVLDTSGATPRPARSVVQAAVSLAHRSTV